MRKYFEVDVVHTNGYVEKLKMLFRSKSEAYRMAKEVGGQVIHTTWALKQERENEKSSKGAR